MKDVVIIDRKTPQWKGNLHLHTDRSPDSVAPYLDVLEEYRRKGYHFCVVSDHELYWDSEEADTEDFLVLAGSESSMRINPIHEWNTDSRTKFIHIQMIRDLTRECDYPYRHNERIARCYDQGLDCMNEYLRYLVEERGQLVQMNHPDWSHLEPEILLATDHCFAFEVYNHMSSICFGGISDDWRWDYCLERGRRLLATAGDDSHHYAPDLVECGGSSTMVCTNDFSKVGLVRALKAGHFYPTMGPQIYDMRIESGVLKMEFSDAVNVSVVAYGTAEGAALNHGKGFNPRPGEFLNTIEWPVNSSLNYFRVRISGPDGAVAWSQPVFLDDLEDRLPEDSREEERHLPWSIPRYLDEIKAQK